MVAILPAKQIYQGFNESRWNYTHMWVGMQGMDTWIVCLSQNIMAGAMKNNKSKGDVRDGNTIWFGLGPDQGNEMWFDSPWN